MLDRALRRRDGDGRLPGDPDWADRRANHSRSGDHGHQRRPLRTTLTEQDRRPGTPHQEDEPRKDVEVVVLYIGDMLREADEMPSHTLSSRAAGDDPAKLADRGPL